MALIGRLAAALALLVATASALSAAETTTVTIAREDYRGWPDTMRIGNGRIEARVVTAIGPRVIDLHAAGGDNLFHVRDQEAGGHGETEWMFRGGWRLWIAPERRATTYVPDNSPCQVEIVDGRVLRVTGPPQPAAGIQKVVEFEPAADQPCLRVRSHIRNIGREPLTYAAWSLSVMRPGGRAVVPLDVGSLDAFDATRKLILWSYTEMADPRYRFGDRLVEVDQSRVAPPPTAAAAGRRDDESKIGVDSAQGWAAYRLGRTVSLKRFPHDPAGRYPDGGATIEIYSSAEFLEVENLSPLTTIPPGGELVYPEEWWVFGDVDPTDEALLERVESTKSTKGHEEH
ncbi:MAG TPA: hypothetical protein VL049_21170 [Candidatus Dormibacteraeota bacterium]|nr:hypothetical protein [Candidatus Dormibacteraeota bacterium]